VHMIEKALQHHGEMNALFWQVGQDPPSPDSAINGKTYDLNRLGSRTASSLFQDSRRHSR
jgi:hypothetical protein